MSEFFAMGGYGAYVWSAYGLTALVVGGLTVFNIGRCVREQRRLRRLEEEAER